tara:strand:+ start:2308 stop:2625 length:318 start_codon:yes stop_codon:yes gene_type:complete
MAATFTWTVSQCDRVLADGGINNIHWQCSATETASGTDYAASSYGTCRITYDASSSDFIAYDNVTQDDCLSWIYANGVDKDAIETSLQAKIDLQITPTTGEGVPW